MYFRFNDSAIMNRALTAFWHKQARENKPLTAFDSFSSSEGECRISEGYEGEDDFHKFLEANNYSFRITQTGELKERATRLDWYSFRLTLEWYCAIIVL